MAYFPGIFGMTAGVGGLHCGASSRLALLEHQGTAGSPVTAAKHPLAENTRNRPHDIAHGFEFLTGDLIVVAQSKAVSAEDLSDHLDIPFTPGSEHPFEPPLRMLDVIQTLAEMRVTGTEFCEDRPEEILGADITQQSDAERFAAEIHHLGALGMADLVGRHMIIGFFSLLVQLNP